MPTNEKIQQQVPTDEQLALLRKIEARAMQYFNANRSGVNSDEDDEGVFTFQDERDDPEWEDEDGEPYVAPIGCSGSDHIQITRLYIKGDKIVVDGHGWEHPIEDTEENIESVVTGIMESCYNE